MTGIDPRDEPQPYQELYERCLYAKISLSSKPRAIIPINYRGKRAGKHVSATKRRVTFQFGFSSARAIAAAATGPLAVGAEREIAERDDGGQVGDDDDGSLDEGGARDPLRTSALRASLPFQFSLSPNLGAALQEYVIALALGDRRSAAPCLSRRRHAFPTPFGVRYPRAGVRAAIRAMN